ncbi:MAG: aminotransferase class I/II-fold pyridoxal phosphate-dependent enzyme [Candidatus Eisenbacteria bacterium]|nr:aminotransferase class I/II-fold pyridoxal phosphate-dependent enzyme [Candidatus Eisenbacteria bacterium]
MTGLDGVDPARPGESGPADIRPDTLAVHGADFHDTHDRAHVPPIHLTTVFQFESVEDMAATFRGERPGWIYTRYGNPTLALVERHLAALEGAEAALAVSSGMAAISTLILSELSAGDHLVAAADLYGGTRNLLDGIVRRMGITTSWAAADDPAAFRNAIRPGTKAIFVETPTNPTLRIADLTAIVAAGRETSVPVFVDNTFATPILQRPLDFGATAVIHSATKALAGHDDVTAGVIVGTRALVDRCRETMKWLGGCLDPHAAWLLERGIKTLGLRIARQSQNALVLARWLEQHPAVRSVNYPGLATHSAHDLAARQMRGFGGILAFDLAGGEPAVRHWAEGLSLIRLAPTLGGVETIALIPAVSSHIRLSSDERLAAGISDGTIRISCGIEDPADLIKDLDRALGRHD